jgi:ATP-dependent RNA helicase DDX19/DBP5
MSVVVAMGKFTAVQTEYAIRDNLPRGTAQITAQIVVGTPGTMINLIHKKVIDVTEVKVLVLDEADNMLDQDGLGDQTLRLKKYSSSVFPFSVTRMLTTSFAQHGLAKSAISNHSLLSNIPGPRAYLCKQVCAKREQNRAQTRRTLR